MCEDSEEDPARPDSSEPDARAMASQALVAYVFELLEKGFPVSAIMAGGSSLSLKSWGEVKAEDTISLSGVVTGKHSEGEVNRIDCLVTIENQDNVVVAEAEALIAL